MDFNKRKNSNKRNTGEGLCSNATQWTTPVVLKRNFPERLYKLDLTFIYIYFHKTI